MKPPLFVPKGPKNCNMGLKAGHFYRIKNKEQGRNGNSLAVHWVGLLRPFTAEDLGSVPHQRTKIPASHLAAKKKKKKEHGREK